MMRFEVVDVSGFKSIIQPVTRFSERAHVEASEKGIRLRSIDSHDFCYSDVRFLPKFFEGQTEDDLVEFGLDISKLGLILHCLPSSSPLQLVFGRSSF